MVAESKKGTEKVEKMEVDEVKKAEPAPKDLNAIALDSIREHISLIDRGESHFTGRVLQVLHKTRKQLNHEVLHKLISTQPFASQLNRDDLLKFIPEPTSSSLSTASTGSTATAMEVDAPKSATKSPRPTRRAPASTPESELYTQLLVLLYVLDQAKLDDARGIAESLLARVDKLDRRSADPFAAKAIFYLALIAERQEKLTELCSYLNMRLRTATLRQLNDSKAVLINTVLRSYLINKQYQSATKFVSKVSFPENSNNSDLARFLYYEGRIAALQLNYSAAMGHFNQAIRKAPQEAAIGFKQNAQKWVVVISLLLGEIPERSIFRQPIHRKTLVPYLELTQAVRLGDLVRFNGVLDKYGSLFEKDETLTLIVRLKQNVIKTAIKQICVAYSKITIKDIAKKLQMANEVETEYMVAKAIADGAIDAVITSDSKGSDRYMKSSETADVYRTTEPQYLFDSRIRFCLDLHNQAVKALRYPPKNKLEVESIEAQREREQQELEFAKELADDDDDF